MNKKRGTSLIEVLISIAILGILVATVVASFSAIRKAQVLESSRNLIIATLTKAKSDTLASKDSKSYGVHIDDINNKLVVFEGTTYNGSAPTNQNVPLDTRVYISAYSGGADIVFGRLTGFVSALHGITISIPSGASKYISIFPTGVILSE